MRLVYDNPRFEFRGVVDSYCHLRIWRSGPEGDPTSRAVVMATDPDDLECGTSITNAVEDWASLARAQHLASMPLERITFIEHYPHANDSSEPQTFDAIFLSDSPGGKLHSPAWQRMEHVWVEAAIAGPLES